MWGYGFGPMLGFGLLHLLFWIAMIALVVWVIRALFAGGRPHGGPWGWQQPQPPSETPLEILQKRFARGEITEAEYKQAKQALA